MARGNGGGGGGCSFFPLLGIFIAVALWYGGDERRAQEAGDNPRRPPVAEPVPGRESLPVPEYGIEELGAPQDSQGTAFAITGNGLWLTAQHVVRGCDKVGLATAEGQAELTRAVYESQVSDAALIGDGMAVRIALPLSARTPGEGADGYHMGFPAGQPAVVHSRLIGPGSAIRGPGRVEPVLAWAEVARAPDFDGALSGISGGPTLDAAGEVVGINSAASERRGRVLTTRPEAAINLVQAARMAVRPLPATPLFGLGAAAQRFDQLRFAGTIRPVYCDVKEAG